MWHRWAALGLTPAVTAIALTAFAQDGRPGFFDETLAQNLYTGTTVEQYLAALVGSLRSLDRSGDGLDQDDVNLAGERELARRRADLIGQVLKSDLNGDFRVTREEIQRATSGDETMQGRQAGSLLKQYDSNSDGVITLQEIVHVAAGQSDVLEDRGKALLALDPDHDGRLTAVELRTIAERYFASVDVDGDGKISAEEFAPVGKQRQAAALGRLQPGCSLPSAPAGAQIVAFGVREEDAISSAVIGGQDQETGLIDVKIEPGIAPLYVVLNSYGSMVWRLSGDSKRVVQLVVGSMEANASRQSLAGAIGLPRERVSILPSGCLGVLDGRGYENAGASPLIRKAVGRSPDAIFGTPRASIISLPSGTSTRGDGTKAIMPQGFDPESWRDAIRFWPGGLIEVDTRSIVADARVEQYKVLPSQMGLAQLIGQGAITKTGSDRYRIVRPIAHIPPKMSGSHAATFDLAPDVPMPVGDLGHSCIRSDKNPSPLPCQPPYPVIIR